MAGKRWQPIEGSYDNCLESLARGRLRWHRWAAEEVAAWLLLQMSYYDQTEQGLNDRAAKLDNVYVEAALNHTRKMKELLEELIRRLHTPWDRRTWNELTAAFAAGIDPGEPPNEGDSPLPSHGP